MPLLASPARPLNAPLLALLRPQKRCPLRLFVASQVVECTSYTVCDDISRRLLLLVGIIGYTRRRSASLFASPVCRPVSAAHQGFGRVGRTLSEQTYGGSDESSDGNARDRIYRRSNLPQR